MYLSELDVIGLTIALVSAIALIITSATANARLTRQRNEWRDDALWWNAEADDIREERNYWREIYHNYKFATEAEAMGKSYSWNSVSNKWEYTDSPTK